MLLNPSPFVSTLDEAGFCKLVRAIFTALGENEGETTQGKSKGVGVYAHVLHLHGVFM